MIAKTTTALIMGLALLASPLGSTSAEAGDRHHKPHHGKKGWKGGYGHYGAYGSPYGHHPRYGHYPRHGWNTHYHKHGLSKGEAAILGVGVGLVVASAINSKSRRADPPTVIYTEPYPAPQVVYRSLPPQQAVSVAQAPAPLPAGCMQTREYQTTIIVGGVERAAYGTACLMPDGAWMTGPATPEPVFN